MDGQLGRGVEGAPSFAPIRLTASHQVTQVAPGDGHMCMLARGGLYCWGRNLLGQLGNGTTGDGVFGPVVVPF